MTNRREYFQRRCTTNKSYKETKHYTEALFKSLSASHALKRLLLNTTTTTMSCVLYWSMKINEPMRKAKKLILLSIQKNSCCQKEIGATYSKCAIEDSGR